MQILKAVLLHDAQSELDMTAAELESLLEQSTDAETLQETEESMVADGRTVVFEDNRVCILDTPLADSRWHRCALPPCCQYTRLCNARYCRSALPTSCFAGCFATSEHWLRSTSGRLCSLSCFPLLQPVLRAYAHDAVTGVFAGI